MKGSCLCGAVTYEADAPGLGMGHCSCRICRKAHAANLKRFAEWPPGRG